MPKKGYKQTKEHIEKQRQIHLGLKQSNEAKEKNRQSQLKRYKEKPVTDETKEKLRKKSKGNKYALGYKYTKEQKERRRLQVLKQFENGMPEETIEKIRRKRKLQKNTNKGKHWKIKDTSNMHHISWSNGLTKETDERVRKMSEKHKGKHWKIKDTSKMRESRIKYWGNIENRKKQSKRFFLYYSNPINRKKQSISKINCPNRKYSNTTIERKIATELMKRRIYFQQNIGLANIANVDFYLPEYRTVIECDGDYWHNRPGVKENDERKTNLLKQNGYKVYRFWEHEINESTEKCVNKIFKGR